MYHEEKTFRLRVTLEASFPDDYDGEEDESNWIREWESRIKPHLIKSVFDCLRQQRGWSSHIRNRGLSPTDEIEIVVSKDFSKPAPLDFER
ncbi:MAG: hypothetical protein A4C66_10505 [Nitrospira sp. HN-bin3]|uniref:hypothetical protein n=1 Tax=Nitrospira cf. moscoviensis SBR1015 TaxID=96242 RepID=UPI000A0A5876|nr:hypothetical protein [Nitrospira cf. moscoviensis SBR1015]MBH0207276.1 hypothetical protein [Nitrospira sp.]OQW40853.1 MAG: hypothetical protein A4C66_10505 [Nitrospira sp. HN-bin3]